MSFLSWGVSSSANHCIRHHGFRPSDVIFPSLDGAHRIVKCSENERDSRALSVELFDGLDRTLHLNYATVPLRPPLVLRYK